MCSANVHFLAEGGSKTPTDLLHDWPFRGGNVERFIMQVTQNPARDAVAQGLSATRLLPRAGQHPEASGFHCV